MSDMPDDVDLPLFHLGDPADPDEIGHPHEQADTNAVDPPEPSQVEADRR